MSVRLGISVRRHFSRLQGMHGSSPSVASLVFLRTTRQRLAPYHRFDYCAPFMSFHNAFVRGVRRRVGRAPRHRTSDKDVTVIYSLHGSVDHGMFGAYQRSK